MPAFSHLISGSTPEKLKTQLSHNSNIHGTKNNTLKYQYSFTDSLALSEDLRTNEFKVIFRY